MAGQPGAAPPTADATKVVDRLAAQLAEAAKQAAILQVQMEAYAAENEFLRAQVERLTGQAERPDDATA